MKELSLYELYSLLKDSSSRIEINEIKNIILEKERLIEDTSATGGPSSSAGSSSVGVGSAGVSLSNATTAGMGQVVSSQPSSLPGALTGTAWITGGGLQGSGDVSVPYNPSGPDRVFQKIPAPGKNKTRNQSDPNVITKKSRVKPLNIKTLKDLLKDRKPQGKVMNFSDFEKKEITTKVTKVKEGKAFDVAKKSKKEMVDISKFQDILKSHIKSLGCDIKQVGSDFEIHLDKKHIAQVMFREDYIGIKKEGNKFPKEFDFTQLGKIKSEITDIIKSQK